jgi:hypothetical protein
MFGLVLQNFGKKTCKKPVIPTLDKVIYFTGRIFQGFMYKTSIYYTKYVGEQLKKLPFFNMRLLA